MTEASPTINPPVDTESRLKRAAELAEYLRQNPRESKREPEELATQFGLHPAVVAQIQANLQVRTTPTTTTRPSIVKRLKNLWDGFARLAGACVSKPYVFQTVAAVLTACTDLSPKRGAAAAFFVWFGMQAWCLLLKPRFRYAVFGTALLWVVASVWMFQSKQADSTNAPFSPQAISALFGFAIAFLNLIVCGLTVVLGGWIQIAVQRRKSASLSRQDLLMRMFELQRQLASLPAQSQKPPHPWITFVRQRPFLTAAVLIFAVTSLEYVDTLLSHIDPLAFQKLANSQQGRQETVGVVKVVGLPAGISGMFLVIQSLLGVVSNGISIGLGWLANTWRKVALVLAGLSVGSAIAVTWATLAGAFGPKPGWEPILMPINELTGSLFWILIVRFVVGFNRSLSSYRVGVVADEASIVGELLEIRHRLSSNPTLIFVLVVDAAGSTQMKKVDDPLHVEYSFGRYQNWLGQIVVLHGGTVEIPTGDGAICAFSSAEPALAAAWQMQTDVKQFNEKENKLDMPFRLRIALHAGSVQADLDKVQFTEVIDVAAHTEKHSPIGGIALTASFIQALPSAPDLPICGTVDGFEVRSMTV